MELKQYRKGEAIIRQGEFGDCMYCVRWGRVGVYSDYGTAQERKLAELGADDFFGEMELLDKSVRSATVVALEGGTKLEVITEADFNEFFARQPAKVHLILQRLCQKLRKTPETLARDILRFQDLGYALQAATAVDMFPRTSHIETVCCLYHQKKDFISVPYELKGNV